MEEESSRGGRRLGVCEAEALRDVRGPRSDFEARNSVTAADVGTDFSVTVLTSVSFAF